MSKPKPKKWDDVPFETWKYEKQTEMKHKIFSYYLPLWLRIVGRYEKRLNYIDGFGGLGAYHTEEDIKEEKYISNNFGSPIISIQKILELKEDKKIESCKVVIIDESGKYIDNIKQILEHKGVSPDFVSYESGDFDTIINKMLDSFDEDKKELAPTFFLLDPFGMKGIKLETLKRIMNYPKTEILLNFMYNSLQRWINHPDEKIKTMYDGYFGSDIWRRIINKKTQGNEDELVKFFCDTCKEFSPYVYPFKFKFPTKNQTYYYLIHLSQHWKGCAIMKDAVAANNEGVMEYSGGKRSLWNSVPIYKRFDRCDRCYAGKELNLNNCGECFKVILPKQLNYKEIMKELIDATPFQEKDIKTILQNLEKEGSLKVIPGLTRKGKRRGGFKVGDVVCFK